MLLNPAYRCYEYSNPKASTFMQIFYGILISIYLMKNWKRSIDLAVIPLTGVCVIFYTPRN